MRIAVIGATGRTGREFVDQALDAGHEITAFVRRPEAVPPRKGVTVVGGQLTEVDALTDALKGCDAVVITLGPKISDRNKPLMQTAVPAAVTAAKKAGVSRIIVLSALGAGSTLENTRYPYKLGARTFLAGNFRDHVAGESKLEDSGLNWTTIHPGPLFDKPRTPKPLLVDAATGRKLPGSPRTYRADVAAAMLKVLVDARTYGKKMLLTSAVQRE